MAVTRISAVIYLDKQYFDYYDTTLQTPLRFTFLPDTVAHFDILQKDKLVEQLTMFITTYKLVPVSIILLLSDDTLFCKEIILEAPLMNDGHEMQSFLSIVPFERVLSKTYRMEKKEIIVTTNQDFLDIFQRVFGKHNSRVDLCIPAFLLGKAINLSQGLNKEQAKLLIAREGSMRPWTMPVYQQVVPLAGPSPVPSTHEESIQSSTDISDAKEESSSSSKKTNKNRIYAMVAVFVILIGLMIFMFMQMQASNAKDDALSRAKHQKILDQQSVSTPSPQNVPTPTTAAVTPATALPLTSGGAFSATTDEQQLHVALQYPSASASDAAQIKQALTTFGISNVTQNPDNTLSGDQNLLLFTNKLSKASQQRILTIIRQVDASIVPQENDQLSVDILVVLK